MRQVKYMNYYHAFYSLSQLLWSIFQKCTPSIGTSFSVLFHLFWPSFFYTEKDVYGRCRWKMYISFLHKDRKEFSCIYYYEWGLWIRRFPLSVISASVIFFYFFFTEHTHIPLLCLQHTMKNDTGLYHSPNEDKHYVHALHHLQHCGCTFYASLQTCCNVKQAVSLHSLVYNINYVFNHESLQTRTEEKQIMMHYLIEWPENTTVMEARHVTSEAKVGDM